MHKKGTIALYIIVVLILLAVLFFPDDETIAVSVDDYNKYIYSHGITAYFNNQCAFWDVHPSS